MKNCKSGVFSSDARPNHRPPAQRSSNSDSFTCTSTASIGSNQSIGDPGIRGVAGLQVGGNDVGPHGQSAPVTVASESDCGSSYASPCNPSMTAFQSHECRRLFGSTPSLRSVCLAPSSLSSPPLLGVHSWQLGVPCILLLLQHGGVVGPTYQLVGPQSCNPGCLIRNAWHIICQGYGRPLPGPCKIVGEATCWNPLCFILGWVICQDAPLKH